MMVDHARKTVALSASISVSHTDLQYSSTYAKSLVPSGQRFSDRSVELA
jgi:hypothetical protein